MDTVQAIETAIEWLDVLAEYVDDENDFMDIQACIIKLRHILRNTED